jgi:hypothetical protein
VSINSAVEADNQEQKGFAEWSEVFPHAACVVTLVDRLIHGAKVIDIEADSYRIKEAKELTAARTKRRSRKPTADVLFTGELHRLQARSSPLNFNEYPPFLIHANRQTWSTA